MKKPILIVGAGFSGAVLARELAEAGYTIHLQESRDHLGGNCADYTNEYGIRVHRYGPHLFHTDNETVWNYVQQWATWIPYRHRVRAQLADGRTVVLPVNRETAEIVGRDNILDIFYRPYTRKMWGVELEELDPGIAARVPVRDDLNEDYFPNDRFQALPRDGYSALFSALLDHANIHVQLGVAWQNPGRTQHEYEHIFSSMPIDLYYDYRYGELPYRSIRFHHSHVTHDRGLPVATVNFTDNGPYTRRTEWSKLPGHGGHHLYTTITYEEPCDYRDNNRERYYPVKDLHGKNRELYRKYADIPNPHTTFIGRCGQYAYLDMHQAIAASLSLAKKYIQTPQNGV